MLTIQIISAVFLLLNKIYLRQKKAISWIYGIIGMIILAIYFYLQMILQHKENLWILIILNIALVVLMSYGYLVAMAENSHNLKKILKDWNVIFKIIVVTITLLVCSLLLIQAINSQLVIAQFIFAVTILVGTLLLALNKKITNICGWALYFIAHIVCTYIVLKTNSPVIAGVQMISAFIALDGIRAELKK